MTPYLTILVLALGCSDVVEVEPVIDCVYPGCVPPDGGSGVLPDAGLPDGGADNTGDEE